MMDALNFSLETNPEYQTSIVENNAFMIILWAQGQW